MINLKKDGKEEKPRPQYTELKAGDKIQDRDEYCSGQGTWRVVPDFLWGDKVPEGTTLWRRPALKELLPKKKKWFWF